MPVSRSLLRRLFRRIPFKKLFILTLLLSIPIATWFYYCLIVPLRRAESHERKHFQELDRLQFLESFDEMGRARLTRDHYATWSNRPKPEPYNKRLLPLIHDAEQLRTATWRQQLNVYDDGFAQGPQQELWIYVAGTYRKPSFWERFDFYSAPNGSCMDPPEICDSFNAAFNEVVEHYHVVGPHSTIPSGANEPMFMDCDVSSLLRDDLYIGPVMLVHLKTDSPCKLETYPTWHFICSTKWSFIELPLKKMPVTKTLKIGGYVVPVFPSAFEQLHAMIALGGSVDALDLQTWEVEEHVVDTTGVACMDDK